MHTRPDPAAVANGAITVSPVHGWFSTSACPPVTIQPAVLVPGANALDMLTTNAGTAVIGN